MHNRSKLVIALGLLMAIGACHSDRPHEYGQQRPPVDRLDQRDRGLQSKDVVSASDQMAMDLLGLPELNDRGQPQWTIVVDRVENLTASRRQDLDIFLERLRVNLARHGKGRVLLIENRDKLRDLQARELELGGDDRFGQTGGRREPGPRGIQPDFALYGRIMEMPNRATSYFFCEFTLTDLHNRTQVWTNAYEVKVQR